jgi:glycerol uptake operon antiterminator
MTLGPRPIPPSREETMAALPAALAQSLSMRPVMATMYGPDALPAFLAGPAPVGILANIPLIDLEGCVEKTRGAGKFAFVNMDSCDGLAQDRGGVEYLKKIGVLGIVSTRGSLIARGNSARLVTMQKVFITDRSTLPRSLSTVRNSKPGIVQLMPWPVLPYIPQAELGEMSPFVAAGFVSSPEDVKTALDAGALAVSTSDARLWRLTRRTSPA